MVTVTKQRALLAFCCSTAAVLSFTLPCAAQTTKANNKANPAQPMTGVTQPATNPNPGVPSQPSSVPAKKNRPAIPNPGFSGFKPSKNYDVQALMQKSTLDYQQNQMLTNMIVSSSIKTPLTLNNNAFQSSSMMNPFMMNQMNPFMSNSMNPYMMNPFMMNPLMSNPINPFMTNSMNPYAMMAQTNLYQPMNPWQQPFAPMMPQTAQYNPWGQPMNPYMNPFAQPGIIGPWQQQLPWGMPGNQNFNPGFLAPGVLGPNPFARF